MSDRAMEAAREWLFENLSPDERLLGKDRTEKLAKLLDAYAAERLEGLRELSEKATQSLEYVEGGEYYCPILLFAPHPLIPDKKRRLLVDLSPAARGENEALAKLIVACVNYVRSALQSAAKERK